jgi:metal-responsive CopG/Arc/MetJ family transcriptional regulator
MKRSLSITLDRDLVSRVEQLAKPAENRSAAIERLLLQAVEAAEETALMERYARGYAEHPYSEDELSTFAAMQRLSARSLPLERQPDRTRRATR